MALIRKPKPQNRKNHARCSFCGSPTHSSINCWQKPRIPIKKKSAPIAYRSKKTERLERELRREWRRINPPIGGNDGRHWICYLQISRFCPVRINDAQLTLEHVYPRVKYPELKYEVLNIKPSCAFCNKLKLSNTPRQLAIMFPRVAVMIQQPSWIAWEQRLAELSPRLKLQLERDSE